MSLQIKPETMLAVLEQAMQSDPNEYCGEFVHKHDEVGETKVATTRMLFVEDDNDMES